MVGGCFDDDSIPGLGIEGTEVVQACDAPADNFIRERSSLWPSSRETFSRR